MLDVFAVFMFRIVYRYRVSEIITFEYVYTNHLTIANTIET